MLIAQVLPHSFRRVLATLGLALSITAVPASTAQAHCDTMDGPVVAAAKRALDTGAEKYVLIWVRAQDEPEIRNTLRHALAVRKLEAVHATAAGSPHPASSHKTP